MGWDATRVELTDEPLQILHPDRDNVAGLSALFRCDTADVVVGGPAVTPATGYHITAGTEWGWDGATGAPYVMLAAGAGPTEAQVLWEGV